MENVINDLLEFSDKYDIPLNHAIFILRSVVLMMIMDDETLKKLKEKINGSKTMYS